MECHQIANDDDLDERKGKLTQYTDFILSKIMNVSNYPISLRIICRKLQDLAISKDPNNIHLRNSLVGGFIFLRMINPKIAVCGHTKSTQEPYKKYGKFIRRKFTLIVKILQNISNQNESGNKEKWMSVVNEYVCSKRKDVNQFFAKLCSISMNSYHNLYFKMIHESPLRESIYLSVKELNELTSTFYDDYVKDSNQGKNKCFCELLSFVVQKEAFLNEPNQTANFIKIRIPKMKLKDDRSEIEQKIEQEVQSNVIPILRQLSDRYALVDEFQQTGDLLPDLIAFLQNLYASKINIANLEETIIFLANHSNQTLVERVILRLYAECHSNMDIFNRLNQEITEMMIYQQSLYENVSSLCAKFECQRNKLTPQHKKYFKLKDVPALIKDINKAMNDINVSINPKN